MFITDNRLIAVEPFPEARGEKVINAGLKIKAHNNELVPLRVVADCRTPPVYKGSTAYVRGGLSATTQGKEVFTVAGINDGKPFVLLPYDFIVGFEPNV